VTGNAQLRKVAIEYVTKGLASGALKSIIDRAFKFDEMVEVHHISRTAANSAKSSSPFELISNPLSLAYALPPSPLRDIAIVAHKGDPPISTPGCAPWHGNTLI
jgi:hypothetical protein